MTKEHKAALAAGRAEGRAIKNYLEALEQHRPKRGRRRTEESISARLAKIDEEVENGTDPVKRVNLIQERMDLSAELEQLQTKDTVDLAELEAAATAPPAMPSRIQRPLSMSPQEIVGGRLR